MHEILSKLVVVGMSMWRYRRHAVIFAWSIALLGWLAVLLMPNQYEARAKVYVDTETLLRPLLKGLAAETDVLTEVNVMARALLSQPQLEKAARETDLYLRAKTPREQEELLKQMKEKVSLVGDPGNPGLYTISFTDNDRTMSIRVVQKLLDSFVEDTLGIKRQDSSSAQRFLEDQIKDYEGRLKQAENQLAEFKRGNVGLMPGVEGDYFMRLQTAVVALEKLQGEYRVAQQTRDELARQMEGEEPTFGIVSSALENQGPIDSQIAEFRKKLETLLLNYTEKHPDVVALREKIANLEAQKLADRDSNRGPVAGGGPALLNLAQLDVNPVYQRMKIALAEAEVQMAALRGKIADASGEVARLRGRMDTIPQVEAQLAQLNRDYEVNKAQYNALVQRLESARLSGDVEQTRDEVKFRIIEPPMAPIKPVAPNRIIFAAIVLVAAIGAGLGLALLLSQITPVFTDRSELAAATGLNVLGVVTLVRTPELEAVEALRRRRLYYAMAGLVGCFVAVVALSTLLSGGLGSAGGAAQ